MFNRLAIKLLRFKDRKFFWNYKKLVRLLEAVTMILLTMFLSTAIAANSITRFIIFAVLASAMLILLINLGYDQNDLAADIRKNVKIRPIRETKKRRTVYDSRYDVNDEHVKIFANCGIEEKMISNRDTITMKDYEDLKKKNSYFVALERDRYDLIRQRIDSVCLVKIELRNGSERLIPDSIKDEIELVIKRIELVEADVEETIYDETSCENLDTIVVTFEVKSLAKMLDKLCELNKQ